MLAVLGANIGMDVWVVLRVYRVMEHRVLTRAIAGLVLGIVVIVLRVNLEERLFIPILNGAKVRGIPASIDGVTGTIGTTLTVRPDLG